MEKSLFQDKYPVFSLTIAKSDTDCQSVSEILDTLEAKITEHPKAVMIARFNHFEHTQNIDGDINPEIQDAQNIVFCFGFQIPSAAPVAVRPRSIGATDLGDRFVVNFMEAPNPVAQELMESWVEGLVR
ncbi:DUF6858 family protein [Thiomicrorhabdus heinhorstiae]|uniref:DUF302 domain-containing protein n=2 Tax=Thiomicrorhabdus TaxID=2039723 RepID=A0ABS0BVS6_9GAMM|nr:hypothetical protein [Thiomicrorhabdus heinhorstiae]MBF6057930.1 hypothetical protein [Thiomicrorhabdus heinhorstiae]